MILFTYFFGNGESTLLGKILNIIKNFADKPKLQLILLLGNFRKTGGAINITEDGLTSILNNVSVFGAADPLGITTTNRGNTIQRLTTGKRINSVPGNLLGLP